MEALIVGIAYTPVIFVLLSSNNQNQDYECSKYYSAPLQIHYYYNIFNEQLKGSLGLTRSKRKVSHANGAKLKGPARKQMPNSDARAVTAV